MEVRSATKADTDRIGQILAEAFADSATFTWMVPEGPRQERMLRAFFTSTARQAVPAGGTLVAEHASTRVKTSAATSTLVAAAAWMPPGKWRPPWWRSVRSMPAILRAGDRQTLTVFGERGPAVDKALAAVHPREPHWYLGALAVSPGTQSTGLGSTLVRAGLTRADRDNFPSYLECEQHLIGYYERLGFAVMHECPMPEGAPRQWGLRRAPAST